MANGRLSHMPKKAILPYKSKMILSKTVYCPCAVSGILAIRKIPLRGIFLRNQLQDLQGTPGDSHGMSLA